MLIYYEEYDGWWYIVILNDVIHWNDYNDNANDNSNNYDYNDRNNSDISDCENYSL